MTIDKTANAVKVIAKPPSPRVMVFWEASAFAMFGSDLAGFKGEIASARTIREGPTSSLDTGQRRRFPTSTGGRARTVIDKNPAPARGLREQALTQVQQPRSRMTELKESAPRAVLAARRASALSLGAANLGSSLNVDLLHLGRRRFRHRHLEHALGDGRFDAIRVDALR
jgi:hypothetical protein